MVFPNCLKPPVKSHQREVDEKAEEEGEEEVATS